MADVILLFWLGTDFLEILYSFLMWFLKGNLSKIQKDSWICCGSDYLVNLDYGNWLNSNRKMMSKYSLAVLKLPRFCDTVWIDTFH